jgi:hypothetical protein
MTEKHVRQRGRPRTEPYFNFQEFQLETEEIKIDWLFRKRILETLQKAQWHKLEKYGTGRMVANKTRMKDGGLLLEKEALMCKDHGTCFTCTVCGKQGYGKDFTINEDHSPPRIRYTLECGHRQELIIHTKAPKVCPKCGGEIQQEQPGSYFCILCDWKIEFGE